MKPSKFKRRIRHRRRRTVSPRFINWLHAHARRRFDCSTIPACWYYKYKAFGKTYWIPMD